MLGCAALQEEHAVVWRNPHQLAQILLGLGGQAHEVAASMADLHDRGTRAAPLEHFIAGLDQDLFRQRRRASTEIVSTRHEQLPRILD